MPRSNEEIEQSMALARQAEASPLYAEHHAFVTDAETNYLTDLSDLLAMRKEVERLREAADSSVKFIDHTLEFWDWRAFPNLREGAVRLRNQLEESLKHPREQH